MPEICTIGDLHVAYTVSGQGPPLLLLHGAEGDHHMFDELTSLLLADFTVICYDQRDCGATNSPAEAASLSLLADDGCELLHALGFSRAHIFGSSFGGRIAQAMAIRQASRVDHLVLGSTWPLPDALADLNPDGVRRISDLRSRLPASASELAGMFFTSDFLMHRPSLREIFANVRPGTERSQRRAEVVCDSLKVSLAAIRAPTLLLAGDSDQVVPAELTFGIARQLPRARQVLLTGVGHATCLQAPAEVAQALRQFIYEGTSAHGASTL